MQLFSVILFLASIFLASAVDRQYISANGTFANRRDYDSITVKNGGHWGVWTWIDKCPPGSYAIGFSIRVNLCTALILDTELIYKFATWISMCFSSCCVRWKNIEELVMILHSMEYDYSVQLSKPAILCILLNLNPESKFCCL